MTDLRDCTNPSDCRVDYINIRNIGFSGAVRLKAMMLI